MTQQSRIAVGVALGLLALVVCPSITLAAEDQPDIAAMQRELKALQEQLKGLEDLEARVAELEQQLQVAQAVQEKVEVEQAKHKLDGYFQLRYRNDNAADADEFLVRRARLNVRGPVADRLSYRVEVQFDAKEAGGGPTSKTQIRSLYADYKLHNGKLRIGQAKVPFGYELLESVPNLWTAERSVVMDTLFPNQRDIGIQWEHQAGAGRPTFNVGVFNGTGMNASDNNDRKNVMARVDFPIPNGSVALSGYVGENDEGAAATDQDRYGVSARRTWRCGTEFMGEAIWGENLGRDVEGWYAQLGHPLVRGRPNLVFVKYDRYDADVDAPNDLFKRWAVGCWYELSPVTRLTLVHEMRDAEPQFPLLSKWDGDATYLQYQLKY